ncbi:NXPE family member 1-like [Acanthaster planci]|uniref:NXPE family member 1-like n=1 Tax=Acanthaster planci TaxID=133434 RepID=A0A8B7Y8W1_ACAPL|nr:NXPE family member 1-like [Acanthaster planci]
MWDKATFDDFEPAAFENFKAYNNTNRPLDMGLTSYNMTVVKLISPTSPRIRVGDVLKYRIESRDFKGRNRIVGGDFWYATLTSDRSPKASTTGYIADYGNGTYDAFVLAAWPGSAKFNLILVHTSETVYHMRNTVWNSEGRLFFRGYYRFNGKNADGRCSMRRQGTWEAMCDYPAYKSLGSTVLLCEHKAGFPCESLVSLGIDSNHIKYSAKQMAKDFEYLYKSAALSNHSLSLHFHGYVIASHTYTITNWKEEVDALNELNSTHCSYIVLINQWAHFAQWTRDSYIERVRLIRQAVIGLLQRCPDVPVVIKGPHARQHESVGSIIFGSDYFLKDIELINQEAFQGTGAFFLPVWDMNLAYPSSNDVHMPMEVVGEELKMFLGYACDKLMRAAK